MKHDVHAGMFNLAVHDTGEVWNGLLNVNLGATVRLNVIGKAPGHCGVPAVNTTAVPASTAMAMVGIHRLATAMAMVGIHRLATCQPRCAFVGAEGLGAAGCGRMSLLAMDTRKQRSSAS